VTGRKPGGTDFSYEVSNKYLRMTSDFTKLNRFLVQLRNDLCRHNVPTFFGFVANERHIMLCSDHKRHFLHRAASYKAYYMDTGGVV
jgi:hypothetical protein